MLLGPARVGDRPAATNHGSIFLLAPVTERARAWVAEHVASESWQWFGHALAKSPSPLLAAILSLAATVARVAGTTGMIGTGRARPSPRIQGRTEWILIDWTAHPVL
jgi:hypothetical protein